MTDLPPDLQQLLARAAKIELYAVFMTPTDKFQSAITPDGAALPQPPAGRRTAGFQYQQRRKNVHHMGRFARGSRNDPCRRALPQSRVEN
jgi:hypothetical protein